MFKLVKHDKNVSVMEYYECLMGRKMKLQRELDIVNKDLDTVNSDLDIYKRKFLDHVIDRNPDEAEEANNKIESLIERRESLEKQKVTMVQQSIYLIGYINKIDRDMHSSCHTKQGTRIHPKTCSVTGTENNKPTLAFYTGRFFLSNTRAGYRTFKKLDSITIPIDKQTTTRQHRYKK